MSTPAIRALKSSLPAYGFWDTVLKCDMSFDAQVVCTGVTVQLSPQLRYHEASKSRSQTNRELARTSHSSTSRLALHALAWRPHARLPISSLRCTLQERQAKASLEVALNDAHMFDVARNLPSSRKASFAHFAFPCRASSCGSNLCPAQHVKYNPALYGHSL
eukprot:6210036-Pleurochrysis_carterae.AAC.2